MPRPGPRRIYVPLRLSAEGLAFVDKRAAEEGILYDGEPNRSEMIRLLIAYAAARMPHGWRPTTHHGDVAVRSAE